MAKCLEDLLGGRRNIHAGHVEAWCHDLVHGHVRQREDAEQHVALGNAEIGLERAGGVDERMQSAIRPCEQPEQRPERRERPAREREGGLG